MDNWIHFLQAFLQATNKNKGTKKHRKKEVLWGAEFLIVNERFLAINPFVPTVPTFSVRETASLGIMGVTLGAPLKPLRDDSVL